MITMLHCTSLRLFFVLDCLLFLFVLEAPAADKDKAEATFRSRVPSEVGKFAEQFQNLIAIEANLEMEWQEPGKEKQWSKTIALLKKHGQFYFSGGEKKGGNFKILEVNNGINSQYCFELKKNKSGNAWIISNVVFVTPDFDERKQGFTGSSFRRDADDFISELTSVHPVSVVPGGIHVAKLFDLPSFQLASASLEGSNQEVLRVNFSYEGTDPETNKPCRLDSILEFDLGMHCLPAKLHQTFQFGEKNVIYDWRREWSKTSDRSYTVERSDEMKIISGGVTKRRSTKDILKISTRDLPESDFTLSAFGFPEPPGVEWKKPFPYYLVAAGVGVVCMGVFFFLRLRSQHKRASG